MGKRANRKPKSKTKRQQQQNSNKNKSKPGKVIKNKIRHAVVKVRLSPGNMEMVKQQATESGNKGKQQLLQRSFKKIKDVRIKTPKRLKASPKTRRKIDFKTDHKNPTPIKTLRNLPKPKFYRPSEICSTSKNLRNETVADSECIEDLESSCDDDCVILDPSIISIDIDNDNNSQEEQQKLDDSVNEKHCNNVDKLFIVEDNKRNAQLLLKPETDNGLLYSTLSNTPKPKTLVDNDIITIEDSFEVSKPNVTANDSVIILDDYIPLSGVDAPVPKAKPVTKRDPTNKRIRMNDSLFTKSERKKLCAYNSNTFNPTEEASESANAKEIAPVNHKRSIVIDGSNVAFGHGNSNVYSAEGIKYCLQYFENMGHTVKAVVPLFRKNPTKSSNPELLDRLYKEGKIVFTPCKNLPGQKSSSYDDRFILQIAYEWNAAIVSNDNYRDLINENAAFKKIIENRVIGYSWCDNMFILAKDPYGRWGPQLDEILRC